MQSYDLLHNQIANTTSPLREKSVQSLPVLVLYKLEGGAEILPLLVHVTLGMSVVTYEFISGGGPSVVSTFGSGSIRASLTMFLRGLRCLRFLRNIPEEV